MCFGGQNGVILGRRGGSWAFPGVKPVSGGWGCQECYGVGWFQRCTNLRVGTGVIWAEIRPETVNEDAPTPAVSRSVLNCEPSLNVSIWAMDT